MHGQGAHLLVVRHLQLVRGLAGLRLVGRRVLGAGTLVLLEPRSDDLRGADRLHLVRDDGPRVQRGAELQRVQQHQGLDHLLDHARMFLEGRALHRHRPFLHAQQQSDNLRDPNRLHLVREYGRCVLG
jgi:hypothetical protein